MTPTDKLRELREEWRKAVGDNLLNRDDTEDEDMSMFYDEEKICSWWLAKLNEALLSERTRLEGLLPREKTRGKTEIYPTHDGGITTLTRQDDIHDGFNACLREVRERLFGEKI